MRNFCSLLCSALMMGLVLVTVPLSAEETSPAKTKGVKPTFTAEQASALETLTRELVRLDPMLEKVDDPEHKAWVKSKMDKLKERLQELHQTTFDQAKYDELRFSVNVEYQRLALWLRPLVVPKKT